MFVFPFAAKMLIFVVAKRRDSSRLIKQDDFATKLIMESEFKI